MSVIPFAKVEKLDDVAAGSLVSVQYGERTELGFRVTYPDQSVPRGHAGFIRLGAIKEGGFVANAIPIRSHTSRVVNGNTRVVNHGLWFMHIEAAAWDAAIYTKNYAPDQAGLVLLDESGQRGLMVQDSASGCRYLDLLNWEMSQPKTNETASARVWNLGRVGEQEDTEWLFCKRG
jgi:hypothetical protein